MKQIWVAGVLAGGVLVMSAVGLAQGAVSNLTGATSLREQVEAQDAAKEIRTVFLKTQSSTI